MKWQIIILLLLSIPFSVAVPFGFRQSCFGMTYACPIVFDPYVAPVVVPVGGGGSSTGSAIFYDLSISSVSPFLYAGGSGSALVNIKLASPAATPLRDGTLEYYLVSGGNSTYLGKQAVAEGTSNQNIHFQIPSGAPKDSTLKVLWVTLSAQPVEAEKTLSIYTLWFLEVAAAVLVGSVLLLFYLRRKKGSSALLS